METIDEKKITCFVVGPIGDKDAELGTEERQIYEDSLEVLEKVIVPACRAVGALPLRADRITRPGEITEQVFRRLLDSEIVVADVTGANPNVMYELGLRHTLSKITVQIGEKERLPFDVAAIRTIMFTRKDGEYGLIEARRTLETTLRSALADGFDPPTSTRVWREARPIPGTSKSEDEPKTVDEDDEPGFVEKLADMEEGLSNFGAVLEGLTAQAGKIGATMSAGAEETTKSDAAGGGFKMRLAIAEKVAARLLDHGAVFEAQVGEFRNELSRMKPGVDFILDEVEGDPKQREDAMPFIKVLREFVDAASTTDSNVREFREVMSGKVANLTRSTRNACAKLVSAIDDYLEGSAAFSEWKGRLAALK